MARVVEGSRSFSCTPTHDTVRSMHAFAFPAGADRHLPTPDGRKAEYATAKSSGRAEEGRLTQPIHW